MNKKPNVIYVFGDQWRQQATGYAGDPNVKTPNIDSLANQSVNFVNAQAGCPVCTPSRASMLTGQQPLTHGLFVNDVPLYPKGKTIAESFSSAGYDTAYIGKWHVGGKGRSDYIPPERRLGFDYWKVLECTHDYNESPYYAGDSDEKLYWEGYDAIAQTKDANAYIENHGKEKPFYLVLSWGGPHSPYNTAPEEFRKMYDPEKIILRENVPEEKASQAQKWLAGYYAHCSTLDKCLGDLLDTVKKSDLEENTIIVFTSDHGDMLGSRGEQNKQRPYDESIRIPFLLKDPRLANECLKETKAIIDMPDVMPTLLGLCDIEIPSSVEGHDFSNHINGGQDPTDGAALIMSLQPFGQWTVAMGGREYRGLRTKQYTYVRDLNGPWLLYDNINDPYQLNNLINNEESKPIQNELEEWLQRKLDRAEDKFLPGIEYIHQWGYKVDDTGTVPYKN